MKEYIIKLRHIFPSFLIISVGTIAGLLAIRWVFTIYFHVFDIKEEIWELWIPLGFPWIPILIWLRPRIAILNFKNDNMYFVYQMAAWICVGIASIFSQNYMSSATGKLLTLNSTSEIQRNEGARYYKLSAFIPAPFYAGAYTDFRESGRYGETLNYTVYFALPILDKPVDTIENIPANWYGIKYHGHCSNYDSEKVKEMKYAAFYSECLLKFDSFDYYKMDHFERLPKSDDKSGFLKAVEARTEIPANDSLVILVPVIEKFEKHNGTTLYWFLISFTGGVFLFSILLFFPAYNRETLEIQLSGQRDGLSNNYLLNYLIPKDDHFITSIILDINILVYIVMVFAGVNPLSPNGDELLAWGANRREEIMEGQWWRLFTSNFVHSGGMHLLLNMVGLAFGAIFIEPVLGRTRYTLLYLISGLCSSITSIWWYEDTASVGASGAIFGLYGAILALLLTNAFEKEGKKSVLMIIGIYTGINLLWGIFGQTDNAAHIGGLLSGAFFGLFFYKIGNRNRKEEFKY